MTSPLLAQTRIPDQNFAVAIHTACPTCIDPGTNNLLPPAATLTNLNVNNKKIADLSGIEGFTNLKTLQCDSNSLVTLPALPSGLIYLHCYLNKLTALPTLPESLISLYCNWNQLKNLPTLPKNLENLNCHANLIKDNFPALPDKLQYIDFGGNQSTTIPALPKELKYLYCYFNQITSLPTLPTTLISLYCNNTLITCLPILPSGIQRLGIDSDKITCLPDCFPNLKTQTYSGNQSWIDISNPPVCTAKCPISFIIPTATLTGTQTINAGQTANLTLTLTGTGPWDITLSDGKTYTATASPYIITVTPSATTTYTLTTVKTACNTGTASGSAVVTVNKCNLSATITGKTELCEGTTPLTANITGGSKPYICFWSYTYPTAPSSPKDYVDSTTIKGIPNSGSGSVYSLYVKDASGCVSEKVSFTLKTLPTPPTIPLIAFTGNSTVTSNGTVLLCEGQSVTMVAAPSNADSFGWKLDGVEIGKASSLIANKSGNYTLSYNTQQCGSTTSPITIVSVNPLPTIGISTGGKFVVCSGSTLKLSSTGGASGYIYQWKKDNVVFGGNTTAIDVTEAGQYVVTATDSKGCAGSSGTLNITKSNPTATVIGKNTFCSGANTTLTATFQNAVGTLQYQWKQDGKNVGDGKSILTAVQAGSYSVEITDANGCKATSTAMPVTEKGSDIVSIVKPDGPITLYAPNTAVLSATLGYEKDVRFRYQWRKDGKDIAGANGYVYEVTTTGSYAAAIISNDDCTVTSAEVKVIVLVPTAVALNATDEVYIYPNPTDGLLVVSARLQKSNILSLRLLDIESRTLQSFELKNMSEFEKTIDISSYSTGTYVLEIAGKDLLKRVKILKH